MGRRALLGRERERSLEVQLALDGLDGVHHGRVFATDESVELAHRAHDGRVVLAAEAIAKLREAVPRRAGTGTSHTIAGTDRAVAPCDFRSPGDAVVVADGALDFLDRGGGLVLRSTPRSASLANSGRSGARPARLSPRRAVCPPARDVALDDLAERATSSASVICSCCALRFRWRSACRARRLDVCDEPHWKRLMKALFHLGDLLRVTSLVTTICRSLVERVERVEELFLRLLATREELDVVHHQDVAAVAGSRSRTR